MPLSKPLLEQNILSALQNMKENAKMEVPEGTSKEDAILEEFAKDLSQAIHDYILAATVTTTVNTFVNGVAAPLAPSGATNVVGKGTGSGTGNLS